MTILTPILICLAVAAILGALWLFAPQAALQATISVGVIAALGISGGIIGELLPRRWFHWDRFPYKTCAWEKNGKIYEKWRSASGRTGCRIKAAGVGMNMPRPFGGRTTPKTLPDCCRKPVWRSSSTGY